MLYYIYRQTITTHEFNEELTWILQIYNIFRYYIYYNNISLLCRCEQFILNNSILVDIQLQWNTQRGVGLTTLENQDITLN